MKKAPYYLTLLCFCVAAGFLGLAFFILGCNQSSQDSYSDSYEVNQWPKVDLFVQSSSVTPQKATCSDYLRAACRIRGGGSGGSGTCYKIDGKYVYILTCRHVVGKTKEFIVEFWLNGRITGKYAGKAHRILNVDAAVIRIPVNTFKENEFPAVIPISRTAPVMTKPIMSVGSPGLGWQTLFEGYITKMKSHKKGSFEFIPPPKGGRSGSAIFQDGKIVGVLWGRSDEERKGYAVNCMDLQALNKISNLYFTAEWCQYCKEMEPVIKELKDWNPNIQVIDYDLNVAFAELYGIKSLPAYVNTHGETISGIKTREELLEFYIASGEYEIPPLPDGGPE